MNGDERQELAEVADAIRRHAVDQGETPPLTKISGAADALDTSPEVIRVSAWMYVRTIFLIAWSAFRYPLCTTYIDMVSGEVVHIRPGEETWG